MYCIIAKGTQIVGVMLKRDIESEARWKKEELKDIDNPTGMVLYHVDDLKGFDEFTKFYGFKLLRNSKDDVVGISDTEGNSITSNDILFLDINNYPELENSLNKY